MDPTIFLLAAAGFSIMWWRHLRTRPALEAAAIDEALDIAVHVARHEAKARAQSVEPLHLLYGLLQDEALLRDLAKLRADVPAIERRIFADLDGTLRSATSLRLYSVKATAVLARTVAAARAGGRPARPIDLFASLLKIDSSTEQACAAGGVRAMDLLFVLAHGAPEAELTVPDGTELAIVLVNDDVSTMEVVVEVLERDFALDRAPAVELMMRVHHTGQAEVGRFPAAEARERARAASARARAQGFPLLLRLEPP